MLTPSGFIKLLVFNGGAVLKLKHLTFIIIGRTCPETKFLFMECNCLFYVNPAVITIAKVNKENFRDHRTKKRLKSGEMRRLSIEHINVTALACKL